MRFALLTAAKLTSGCITPSASGSCAAGAGDDRDDVGADDAEQDGDDLDHALAPDVGDHDDGHSDEGEPPAGGGVIDGGAGEVQTDHDDHRARDDGREVTHDLFRAEHLEEECEHEVEETCDHDAAERVGELRFGIETFVGGHRRDRGEAAEVGERGAEERGDLELGAHVEQQRAETGEQQRRLDGERQAVALHEDGDEHCCAEHGEHVLQAQDQHSGGAQLSGVVDGFVSEFFLHVIFPLCFLLIFYSHLNKHGWAPRGQKIRPVRKLTGQKETISIKTETAIPTEEFFLFRRSAEHHGSFLLFVCCRLTKNTRKQARLQAGILTNLHERYPSFLCKNAGSKTKFFLQRTCQDCFDDVKYPYLLLIAPINGGLFKKRVCVVWKRKKLSLPKQIGIALLLGILAGYAFYKLGIPEFTTNYLKPFGTIFVNLLKFIVVPVVLLSMIDGIISMGDMKKVGSVGWKTVAYFLVTTAAACVIGLVFANLFNNAGWFPTLALEGRRGLG